MELRDVGVEDVTGEKGAFRVVVGAATLDARRLLLSTGMVDQMLPIDGFRELWGHAIFQCPYCHGWEARDRPWGLLVRPDQASHLLMFALLLQSRIWGGIHIVHDDYDGRLVGSQVGLAAIARAGSP